MKPLIPLLAFCLATPLAAQEPMPATAPDPAAGADLFATYCAACHGLGGRGDGHMAELLTVLPPDLTGLARRNGGDFPTFEIVAQIDGRDPVLAHGGDMPLFGRFFEGQDAALATPEGQPILTSRPIVDLVGWLREIQQ